MLIAGVLKFDAEGRVILSDLPVQDFNGDTPIAADGSLAGALDVEPDLYLGSIGYETSGSITNSNNPLLPADTPLRNGDGQLAVDTGLPVMWYAGLPLTASGRLAVSPGILPPDEGAFDQGFDQNAFN